MEDDGGLSELLRDHLRNFCALVGSQYGLLALRRASEPLETTATIGLPQNYEVNPEIVDSVMRSGEAVRIEQAEAQLRLPGPGLRSALAVPLRDLADLPAGFLYAENRQNYSAFSEQHLARARGQAALLETALEEWSQTAPEGADWATLKISKEAFWLRLRRQGLQKHEAGDQEAAEEQLRAALQIAEQWGHNDARAVRTNKDLARVLLEQARYVEAGALLERCLVYYAEKRLVVHPELASALAIQAATLARAGEVSRAEPLFLRALDVWEGLGNPDHADRAWLLDQLGGLYYHRGELMRAGARAREACEIARRLWGHSDPRSQRFQAHLDQVKERLAAD